MITRDGDDTIETSHEMDILLKDIRTRFDRHMLYMTGRAPPAKWLWQTKALGPLGWLSHRGAVNLASGSSLSLKWHSTSLLRRMSDNPDKQDWCDWLS
jgi:hypothetical protein